MMDWIGTRTMGRLGATVPAMGLSPWAIGSPAWLDGKPIGRGDVDDSESIRAIQRALGFGITFSAARTAPHGASKTSPTPRILPSTRLAGGLVTPGSTIRGV